MMHVTTLRRMVENDDAYVALVYKFALRARQLADMSVPVLRKVCEPGVECRTRGQIIEAALVDEFID